ncbi:hypothetical protein [Streptomyces sp. VRA16 Mangrove soil]|uniref:endonuclease domain-containing protein n=1 Tax=Streptomyces sp. VRA16 Mangrove soil TaxID=2817434 RepID=UPI0027DAFCDA|nr:hypothetical protein [Streptomyces sp. VRA16 Mangrove soil]
MDLRVRLVAEQWSAPFLVVSHSAAAWLWGVEMPSYEAEFTAERRTLGRPRAGVRCLALTERDIAVVRRLRCTTVDRTLGDLLRSADPDAAVMAVDSALTRRRVQNCRRGPLTTLARVTAEASRKGPHGRARALALLRLVDPHSGSPAETLARLRIHEAGLHPTSQAHLTTPDGTSVRPDFLFPAEGVAVEIEGYAYHGSRTAHARDLARFNDLQLCPEIRLVLRFTANDVRDSPERMVARIRHALAQASLPRRR